MRDTSFWGLVVTQFLGAFNDNLFKQLVLFVAVKGAADAGGTNWQGVAMFAFAAPFVLFSGVCGVLADRHRKRSIIVLAKLLEIVAMLLGAAAFWSGSLPAMIVVLAGMGAHSTFFGPAKYGILPELFRGEDLPRANGWILMTTFLAIILGVALAGELTKQFSDRLWLGSLACLGTAVVGTLTALPIRRTPIARPDLAITRSSLFFPPQTRALMRSQPQFFQVLVATSVFWCVGGLYLSGVNDLGILQLKIDEAATGRLQACAAIGTAIGCVLAGTLSRGRFEARLVVAGMVGMILFLTVLALPGSARGETLVGVYGAGVVLVVLGISAGLFAVPITVYLQALAPADQKGQIIGVMNLCNWIGILLSGVLHFAGTSLLTATGVPENRIFLVAVALLVPLACWYRPRSVRLGREEPSSMNNDEAVAT
jgi:acyl-[acyl-carrier-protein]-phospholipid O-acyltransferase/long-chain-fatty-acid--[acyl-carrier-protein] ligase